LASPSRGTSSQSSSDVTPRISYRELEYQRMEEKLRRTREELAMMRQENKAEKDYMGTYNAKIQAVVLVRNNITKHLNCIYLLVYTLTL
jgi:hypothetical protein